MKRMNAIVRGRVQGVGFRDATARTARRLGIRGWVRNRADGSVEVLAEGDGQALGQLEAFLRTGPRFAEVTDLELSWPVGAGQDDAAATDQRQNQDQDQRPDPEDFRIYF